MGMWVNKGNSNRDKAFALMALGQGIQGVFGGIGQMVDAKARAAENNRVNQAIKFEQELLPKQHEAYRQIYNSSTLDDTTKKQMMNQLVDMELTLRKQFTPEELLPSRYDLLNTYHNLVSPEPIGMNPRNSVTNATAQRKEYARNQAMISQVPMSDIDKMEYEALRKQQQELIKYDFESNPGAKKQYDDLEEKIAGIRKGYAPKPEQPSAFSELNRNIAITDRDPYMAGYQTPTEIPDTPSYEPSPEAAVNPLVEQGPGLWDKAKAAGSYLGQNAGRLAKTALDPLDIVGKVGGLIGGGNQSEESVAKPLTDEILEQYLNMYNGDIDQAEQALIRDGYTN